MQKSLKIFYCFIIFLFSFGFSQNLSSNSSNSSNSSDINNTIYIDIINNYNYAYIGIKKNFFLKTNYYDGKNIFNASDIEEKISFNTTLEDYYNYYKVCDIICRLWKTSNGYLILLCKMSNTYSPFGEYRVRFKQIFLNYNGYQISINSSYIYLYYPGSAIPLLYADKQNILIEEYKESYELKFKILEYNNELLYLVTGKEFYIYLNNCSRYDNNLICEVKKEDIEEVLHYNNEMFYINAFSENNSDLDFSKQEFIYEIRINENYIKQQDIYVGITKLLTPNINYDDYIAYETNITNISNVNSERFSIERYYEYHEYISCFFKKSENINLLFLCNWYSRWENTSLGRIANETILNDINIKYNFRIQPTENYEIINIYHNYSDTPLYIYPKILNFSLNESLTIDYIMFSLGYNQGIRLLPDL